MKAGRAEAGGRALGTAVAVCAWLWAGQGMRAQDLDHAVGKYRVTDSFEFGGRAVFVSGNRDVYRSTVNYNNGFRLLDGLLRIHSTDGRGRFLDELVLATFGQGGDPYQAATLRVQKNRWYQFDMGFRIIRYQNNLLAIDGGRHPFDTEHILESYDLTLLPQRRIQFVVGYDRSNQNGPSVTSESFNVLGDPAFPRDNYFIFADNLHYVSNQWRAGAAATIAGVTISFLQGLDDYKQDPVNLPAAPGLQAAMGILPSSFTRSEPVHGITPFSRLNIHSDPNRRFSINGRGVYSGGSRNFALDESISNVNPFTKLPAARQTFFGGLAQRTQGSGDLTMSFLPGGRWSFSNTTSANQIRISGDSAFIELRRPALSGGAAINQIFFDLLSDRILTNSTDVTFHAAKSFGIYGGYHYSIRRIQYRELLESAGGGPPGAVPLYSFNNHLNSGLAGIRWRPAASFSMLADVEYGSASRPFAPVAEKNYHQETVRAQWKKKTWLATAGFQQYHNQNASSAALAALLGTGTSNDSYASQQYTAGFSWTPPRRCALDLTYSKLHLNTLADIIAFLVPGLPDAPARHSIYISNLHYGHASLRFEATKRLTLYLGYSIVKDTGDGASAAAAAPPFAISYPNFSFNGTDLIDSYPLTYQSPNTRLSIQLNRRLSWNAGWQYSSYGERFTGLQNYHANLIYTSFRWAF
jgi:hypothetical protein